MGLNELTLKKLEGLYIKISCTDTVVDRNYECQ